jgi:hypothetical protein
MEMAYGLQDGAAQHAYGNIGTQANALPTKPATLQSIIENFDPLIGRLEVLANRAANCGDRINGGRPQAGDTAEKAPEPNHLIWAAQARVARLSRIVDALDSELTRIENGIA